MATRGTFAPELLPEGWFDETLRPEGWFSQDFLEPASGSAPANFVGNATITFAQSGTFNAGSALSGTTTIAFSQTGSFGAASAYVGAATVTFAQTADFTSGAPAGSADFVGNASITFSQSGALSAGAGLAGTSTVTFGQTGALRAGAGLSGGTSITFTQSGAMQASAALSGSATIVFGVSGNFTSGGAEVVEIEWVGDGVGKGRDKADKERLERDRELKAIIAKSFEAVTGEAISPVSAPVTTAQRQSVARRTFNAIETQGYDITLREIERLIRSYERDLLELRETVANDFMRQEDELMMVMLLA